MKRADILMYVGILKDGILSCNKATPTEWLYYNYWSTALIRRTPLEEDCSFLITNFPSSEVFSI
jgi:hypothetical protein